MVHWSYIWRSSSTIISTFVVTIGASFVEPTEAAIYISKWTFVSEWAILVSASIPKEVKNYFKLKLSVSWACMYHFIKLNSVEILHLLAYKLVKWSYQLKIIQSLLWLIHDLRSVKSLRRNGVSVFIEKQCYHVFLIRRNICVHILLVKYSLLFIYDIDVLVCEVGIQTRATFWTGIFSGNRLE